MPESLIEVKYTIGDEVEVLGKKGKWTIREITFWEPSMEEPLYRVINEHHHFIHLYDNEFVPWDNKNDEQL